MVWVSALDTQNIALHVSPVWPPIRKVRLAADPAQTSVPSTGPS